MRRLFRKIKLNNDGVSLVELIVSILILAIIFAPTMSAFVTAMKVNTGAKNTSQAATVAANVMEDVNFYGRSGMKKAYESAQANESERTTLAYTKDPDDSSSDLLTFVNNPDNPSMATIVEGDGKYRVKITYSDVVNVTDYDEDNNIRPRNLNKSRFADITELNESSTVLINPATAHTDFDNLATDHFELLHRAYADRIGDLTWDEIRSRIKKKMYISVIRDTTYGESYYILDSSMIYTFSGDGYVGPGAESWTLNGYCDSVSFDELKTLYLLYSPISGTKTDASGVTYIDWSFGDESVEIDGVDLTDKLNVRIVAQAAADTDIRGTLEVICNTTQFDVTSQIKTSVDGTVKSGDVLGSKKAIERERIYSVKVEVFDADGDGTEVLASLESTILN